MQKIQTEASIKHIGYICVGIIHLFVDSTSLVRVNHFFFKEAVQLLFIFRFICLHICLTYI